eukprot:ANDGO_00267.mRNA.1 Trafficking protein particle complex subunit 5
MSSITVGSGLRSGSTVSGTQLSSRAALVDRPVPRGKSDVSLSLFAHLFAEIVRNSYSKSSSMVDLELRLSAIGEPIGVRFYELCVFRERSGKRDLKLVQALQYVHSNMWKCMFGKAADGIERSAEEEDEYYIVDKVPLVNRFISIPKDLSSLNCGAFVAGIVKGALCSAGFHCKVSAHSADDRTLYLIKFDQAVMEREKKIKS